jgi:hypothetical protein
VKAADADVAAAIAKMAVVKVVVIAINPPHFPIKTSARFDLNVLTFFYFAFTYI